MRPVQSLITIGLLMTLWACTSRESSDETGSDSPRTKPSLQPASASTTTPDGLVRELYRQHDAGEGPFFEDANRALVSRYFDKELADLIWADVTESEAGESMLDADPLYNAQDTDISTFVVHPPTERDGATEVRVTFENFDEPQTLRYRMVRMRGNWRISDIVYPDGSQLFQLLSGPAEETM